MDTSNKNAMKTQDKLNELDALEKMHAEITDQLLEALREKYAILETEKAMQRGVFSIIHRWKINMELAALRRKIRRIIAEKE